MIQIAALLQENAIEEFYVAEDLNYLIILEDINKAPIYLVVIHELSWRYFRIND